MGFFEIIGVIVVFYYVISIFLWIILDSDIQLFIKEKFGQPISSLRENTVWITGASSGIGRELAIVLARNGVRLCISARREHELEIVKQKCLAVSNLTSDDILVLKMDMLDISKHEEYFNKVINHFGTLDVLVNNAGRSQRAPWTSVELAVDREVFELDVFSVVNLSRIYVKYIEKHSLKGHICLTSSGAGLVSIPFSPSYVGAKHALHGYFGSLKIEKPHINVTLFCPGPIATNFLENSFTDKPGQLYGKAVDPTDIRMSAERCGLLMAISIANKLYVSFVGRFPVSLMLYITCYYPNITFWLSRYIGAKQLHKIREGK